MVGCSNPIAGTRRDIDKRRNLICATQSVKTAIGN